jgi:3-isopropylmalate dehydrogenase
MLRFSLGEENAADMIEDAVVKTLSDGMLTAELLPKSERANAKSTSQVGDYIVSMMKTK